MENESQYTEVEADQRDGIEYARPGSNLNNMNINNDYENGEV